MSLSKIFTGAAKFVFLGLASCAIIHGLNFYLAAQVGVDLFGVSTVPIAQGIDTAVNGIASVFSDSASETAIASLDPNSGLFSSPAPDVPSVSDLPEARPGCHWDLTPKGLEEHCAPHGGGDYALG